MQPSAIQIIKSEHRSIGAIIQGLQLLTRSLKPGEPAPDYKILRAMLYYLDTFPERLHHPKEDRYLFARLRQRTQESEDIISRLEDDHTRGEDKVRRLMQAVIRLECGGDMYLREFAGEIESYAEFQWRHMGLEEDVVLPLAQRVLTEDDWHIIDAAFAENIDPLSGIDTKNDFDKLFVSIVNLVQSSQYIP
jgi:hemerythrin-like domain-containing protein